MGAGRPAKRQRREGPVEVGTSCATDLANGRAARDRIDAASQDCINDAAPPKKPNAFLEQFPAEIRFLIYDYAMDDITITAAEQVRNIFNSGEDLKETIPGVPANMVPCVVQGYHPDLLKIGRPPVIPYQCDNPLEEQNNTSALVDSGYFSATGSLYDNSSFTSSSTSFGTSTDNVSKAPPVASDSLLLVNKQIRAEMLDHVKAKKAKQMTLYVNYPYGILVLQKHYPALLKVAKHVVLAGTYDGHRVPDTRNGVEHTLNTPVATTIAANAAAKSMTTTMYSFYKTVTPTQFWDTMPTLQVRIFYPDEDVRKNSMDDTSPPWACMSRVISATFNVKTWKANTGHGITMTVRPVEESERERNGDKWFRHTICTMRRFRGRPRTGRAMTNQERRAEDFWAKSFHDRELFEREVPEKSCWSF